MLNQYISMDDGSCPPARSTALVVPRDQPGHGPCDPILAARLTRLAAASGHLSPLILPGAAVLLLSVHLPLKTARQRKAALPFAVEPALAAPLESCQLALGPDLGDGQYLCAIAERSFITDALDACPTQGPVLPDYLAVPRPAQADAWSLWCGAELLYLRFSDGGALALKPEILPDLWREKGRPALHLWHGTPPIGVQTTPMATEEAQLNADILQMDLRPASHRKSRQEWRSLGRFASVALAITGLLQMGVLHMDATALESISRDRAMVLQNQLSERGIAPSHLDQPTEFLVAMLSRSDQNTTESDLFLSLLSQSSASLATQTGLAFRDLRFDHASATMTVLLAARDLDALQSAETALQRSGLAVTSGAATRTGAGAEMQITISEAV